MALEPITRAEQIIAGKDLQPITRMEMFLKEYGGSGGSGGGGGVFRVELSQVAENQYYADKTYEEIVAAYNSGMEVEAVTVEPEGDLENITIYRLSRINEIENKIIFTNVNTMEGSWYIFEVTMNSNGVVTMKNKEVT